MLQFHIFFFLQLMCVFSPVQAKSKTEQCQCAFNYHSSARKRERECCTYVCVQFSVGVCQRIHICVHIYVCSSMCMCSPSGAHLCHCQYVQAGSGGQLCASCVEGPGCSPDFSWELRWSMSSAENSRNKPPTSWMAIPWRHQPSPWPAAAWAAGRWNRLSTRALCLAVYQNRKYMVFLGSFEYFLFSDEMLCI